MRVVINDNSNLSIFDDFGYDVVLRPHQVDELISELEQAKLAQEAESAQNYDYESSEEE